MLSDTARNGDRRESLIALRDRLAQAIDSCQSLRDLAALANRFQTVLAEIDQLEPRAEAENPLAELRARRAARLPELG